MQVDALALNLRPRSMMEATDLGVRLVQSNARSVWLGALPAYALVVALAASSAGLAPWLPCAVIFWLKPWIDRSLLFSLSRAVFGQGTTMRDWWQARRAVCWQGLVATLTVQRLSAWRAYLLPAAQLEGQRGRTARERRRLLVKGHGWEAALVQFAFAQLELVLIAGFFAMAAWFSVSSAGETALMRWLAAGDGTLPALASMLLYAMVVLVVEPYFVAAGFSMYLNRRVQLEAWDVEQAFRRVFS